jgi:hypothetical protein
LEYLLKAAVAGNDAPVPEVDDADQRVAQYRLVFGQEPIDLFFLLFALADVAQEGEQASAVDG